MAMSELSVGVGHKFEVCILGSEQTVVPEGFQLRREGGNGLKDRAFVGLLVRIATTA